MRFAWVIGLCLILSSCTQREETPWKRDPVYLDLQAKEKEVAGEITAETKQLAELEGNINKAVPQTGQIKFAQKYYYDSKNRIEKLKQKLTYYKLRIKSREEESNNSYQIAFDAGKSWPDPDDYAQYKQNEANRAKARNWSVKSRISAETTPVIEVGKPKGH